jgi:hypothetical protein
VRGEFQERKGVSSRLSDERLADTLVQGPHHRRGQQQLRIIITDTVKHQLRQPAERRHGLARHKHDRHRLCKQSARDERERNG